MSPAAEVAAHKQSDREKNLSQYRLHDDGAKPGDDVAHVQAYPQAALTEKQKEIVNCDATALAEQIQRGAYTCTEVLTAVVTVAIRANDVTNCLTESCLKDAFERAAKLDQHFKTTGKVVGPLHGVPVSIKDHIKVKGLGTSAGYTGKQGSLARTVIYELD